MADQTKTDDYLARSTDLLAKSTREIVLDYIEGYEAERIAASLEFVNMQLPAVKGMPGQLQVTPDQISWGITRRNNEYKVIILSEGKINDVLVNLGKDYASVFVTQVPGYPHSYDPKTASDKRAHPSALRRRPSESPPASGASIGHRDGYPGTLGCYVAIDEGRGIGVISAAHVFDRNDRSDIGDVVLSPRPPDGPRTKEFHIGHLKNYYYLNHFQSPKDNYLNCQDIAVIGLEEKLRKNLPQKTMVWSPEDPDQLMPIKKVIGGKAVADRLGQRVYKVGRTTGLTCGILEIVGLQRQRIVINNLDYIYSNVLAVKRIDIAPFSQAGDSGAVVYTEDGYAIGLVIAGTDQYTFLSPLDACLRGTGATLLAA
jgi:hypothetical protein